MAVNGSESGVGKRWWSLYLNDNALRTGNTAELEEMLTVNYVTPRGVNAALFDGRVCCRFLCHARQTRL